MAASISGPSLNDAYFFSCYEPLITVKGTPPFPLLSLPLSRLPSLFDYENFKNVMASVDQMELGLAYQMTCELLSAAVLRWRHGPHLTQLPGGEN